MVMKNNYLLLFILFFLASSCENFLDVVPEKVGTIDYVFRDRRSAETYLATCYSYMPRHEYQGQSPGRFMGDEITTYYRNRGNGVRITLEGNNVTNPYINYWDGGGGISSNKGLFRGLRSCNEFLDNIDMVRDLDSYEKSRWIAEVKFLKAYYHWVLVQHYGAIPLIKTNLPIFASPEEVKVFRDPLNECIDYIVSLLDEAIPELPEKVDAEVTEYGRITKPIAASLKAKILVHAASPFYNGNESYKNFVDSRGIQLLYSPYDASKWERALTACKEAIEICEAAGFMLYHYDIPYGLNISDSTRLILQPSRIVTEKMNPEIIWSQVTVDSKHVQFDCIPAISGDFRTARVNVEATPTLFTAENFYSSNGVPIEEDVEWEAKDWYANRYQVTTSDKQHRLMIEENFQTAQLHFNRESRFYGSISFDGARWFGGGITNPSEDNQYTVRAKAGDPTNNPAGRNGQQYYSPTGYFIRKLVSHNTVAPNGSFTEEKYFWPLMRLADLYLLYAEALNETKTAPDAEVYKYLNMIRERAGLESIEESWTKYSKNPDKFKTKDGMRDIIHQERLIELAFEGNYYYDIRRWSGGIKRGRYDIMNQLNMPIKGWNIDGLETEDYYQIKTVYTLKFGLRDYLWPIKESNLTQNTNLVQNPGW
jgi:hypothetical protein